MWPLVAGGVGILGGAVAALWFRFQAERARRSEDLQRALAADLKRQLIASEVALGMEERDRAEDAVRLEAVIRSLKQVLRQTEEDLHACDDPAAVRSRLNRLLSSPTFTDTPNP